MRRDLKPADTDTGRRAQVSQAYVKDDFAEEEPKELDGELNGKT